MQKIYFISSIFNFIKRLFILFVRIIEKLLTGQSDYRIYTSEIADFDIVVDKMKAKIMKEEVQVFLRRNFGIFLKRPVVVELYTGDEFDLKGILMELNGSLGRYHFEQMGKAGMVHMVYVRKGLSKPRFKAVLAHEMTHAFLREARLINTDRYLREGVARWIEYYVLKNEGEKKEAEKLKKIRTWKYGKAVNKLFELEEKVGKEGVLQRLKKTK